MTCVYSYTLLCNLLYTEVCSSLSDPDNGQVFEISDGNTAVYLCNKGFTRIGESVLHCVNGKWSSPPPRCVCS